MRWRKPDIEKAAGPVVDLAELLLTLLPPSWFRRLGARALDLFIFTSLALLYPYGTVAGFAFLLLADGLLHGQSPGKWVFGLQVRRLSDGHAAGFRQSALRNIPFLFLGLYALIPLVGVVLLASLGVLILGMELLAIRRDPLRRRGGDILAGTKVVPVRAFRLALRLAGEAQSPEDRDQAEEEKSGRDRQE